MPPCGSQPITALCFKDSSDPISGVRRMYTEWFESSRKWYFRIKALMVYLQLSVKRTFDTTLLWVITVIYYFENGNPSTKFYLTKVVQNKNIDNLM